MSKDRIEEIVVPCSLPDGVAICTETCPMYKTKFFYSECFPNYPKPYEKNNSGELGDSGIYWNKPPKKD